MNCVQKFFTLINFVALYTLTLVWESCNSRIANSTTSTLVASTLEPVIVSLNTIPGTFTVGILGEKIEDGRAFTYKYSLDDDSLSGTLEGFGIGTIQVTGLTTGEHTIYIQATDADGKATDVVQFPFTVK